MNEEKKALIEAGREMLRLVIIAVVPVILTGINTATGSITVDWRVVVAIVLTTLLRAIEKYSYTLGKETDSQNKVSKFLQFK